MRPGRTSSSRVRVALALLGFLLSARPTAAAEPPTVFPRPEPLRESHTRAYVAFAAGAALTVGSFALQRSADRAYDRYLVSTEPSDITSNYDQARRLDRWSAVTLLTGTGGLALGIYWRFIHRPKDTRGTTLEVEPVLTPHQTGLALALRWP